MKNRFLITLAIAAAVSSGSMISAHADGLKGWYLEGTGGLALGSATVDVGSFGSGTFEDEGFNGRIGAGAYISENVRVGLEGGYASFSDQGTDVFGWNVLAVAYYDFHNSTSFTPFLGFGAGYAHNTVENDSGSESSDHFAFKLGSGVGYALSDNLELIAEHAFQYHVESELVDNVDVKTYQNHFNVGLRYSF